MLHIGATCPQQSFCQMLVECNMSIYNQGFCGGMNPSITVTTTAGATVTVTLGMKSVTAIATGGTAEISAWDYG